MAKKIATSAKKKQPKKTKSKVVIAEVIDEREAIRKPVLNRRNYIRRLLNEDNSYKRKFTDQVTLAAQSMLLLQECYFEIMQLESGNRMTVTEISREGNPRKMENPLVTLYTKLDSMCRKNLRALGMNAEAVATAITEVTVENNDPLKALMEKMK